MARLAFDRVAVGDQLPAFSKVVKRDDVKAQQAPELDALEPLPPGEPSELQRRLDAAETRSWTWRNRWMRPSASTPGPSWPG